jgi:hypothetical protein
MALHATTNYYLRLQLIAIGERAARLATLNFSAKRVTVDDAGRRYYLKRDAEVRHPDSRSLSESFGCASPMSDDHESVHRVSL